MEYSVVENCFSIALMVTFYIQVQRQHDNILILFFCVFLRFEVLWRPNSSRLNVAKFIKFKTKFKR